MLLRPAVGPVVDPAPGPGTEIVQGTPSGPDMMVRGMQSSYHCYITLYNCMSLINQSCILYSQFQT